VSYVSKEIIDRRKALELIGKGILLTGLTISSVSQRPYLPRIDTDKISRSIGETALPIPESWYRTFDRVSINSNPLDQGNIESIPMLPIDCKKYCKSNPEFPIESKKFGLLMPDVFEKLKMDFNAKPGQLMLSSTDWYALIPEEPEKTFFSRAKSNIPKEYWHGAGFEKAVQAKMTPYGFFTPEEYAWKDVVDGKKMINLKEDIPLGNHFLGPDQKIITPENKDISMSLDNLVLEIAGKKIPYSKIKPFAEKNLVEYKGQEVPSMKLSQLLELAGQDMNNKALILYANNYAVSIPPWRQQDLRVLFDKRSGKNYGVDTKLTGGELFNKAASIGGFYKIDVTPMQA